MSVMGGKRTLVVNAHDAQKVNPRIDRARSQVDCSSAIVFFDPSKQLDGPVIVGQQVHVLIERISQRKAVFLPRDRIEANIFPTSLTLSLECFALIHCSIFHADVYVAADANNATVKCLGLLIDLLGCESPRRSKGATRAAGHYKESKD